MLDYLVHSVPRVVYKDYYMHDLFEYLNRSTLWVDLVEDVEQIIPEELLAVGVKGVVVGVVSSKKIVF